MARKPYATDLTDDHSSLVEPLLPEAKPRGRPRTTDLREVVNTLLYQNRTGCQWEMLPHDLLPKSTIFEDFAQWRDDGTWQLVLDSLRQAVRALTAPSGEADPSAASIDSQPVKTTEVVGERGYDGNKKNTGRKRHIVVDLLGLLLAVVVTSASMDDAVAAPQVFRQLASRQHPRLDVVWADSKYHNHGLNAWGVRLRRTIPWRLEVVRRPRDVQGFVPLHKRWVLERTFALLERNRRLSRDYEHRADPSECRVRIGAINNCPNALPHIRYTPHSTIDLQHSNTFWIDSEQVPGRFRKRYACGIFNSLLIEII